MGQINELVERYYVDAIIERGEEQLRWLGWEKDDRYVEAARRFAVSSGLSKKEYAMFLLDIFAPIEEW